MIDDVETILEVASCTSTLVGCAAELAVGWLEGKVKSYLACSALPRACSTYSTGHRRRLANDTTAIQWQHLGLIHLHANGSTTISP